MTTKEAIIKLQEILNSCLLDKVQEACTYAALYSLQEFYAAAIAEVDQLPRLIAGRLDSLKDERKKEDEQ